MGNEVDRGVAGIESGIVGWTAERWRQVARWQLGQSGGRAESGGAAGKERDSERETTPARAQRAKC